MDILQIAKTTIKIEEKALHTLHESLDDRFLHCIAIIAQSKGKIICTGIGKSAIIAQKLVATLNSTGTSSIFMHATDAIHGDLGLINDDDVIIAISKSGESSELKVLIPIIKSFDVPILAMTAQENSFLARQAEGILYTPVDEEADPNKLAPTTSTTVQAAMGDAIATVLLSKKGFSPAHFARYHPGGQLGKQLNLHVRDILHDHVAPQVSEQANLKEILLEMSAKRLGATVVIKDQDDAILGIITDGDIRRFLQSEQAIDQTTALQILSKNPKTVQIDSLAFHAFQIMKDHSINQLPVLEKNKYVGMIHIYDLLREGFV